MHEEQLRAVDLRQLRDMRKHRPIGAAVVERDEDFLHISRSVKL